MEKRNTLFILFVFLTLIRLNAQIIPQDRRIVWNPGIPGGIPEITSPVSNIVDYGADPKGVNSSYQAIISAMNALPSSGGVVFIPEGTYRIDSKITIARNNIVLKGTGIGSRLLMSNNGNSIEVVHNERGAWQKVNDAFQKDSKTVAVDDGSKFIPGQFAEIQQDNNPELMYTKPEWKQSWSENAVGQIFEVENVRGNNIKLKTPLHFGFSPSLNIRIRSVNMIKNVGFENFYIEKTVASGNTFIFTNTAYCWIYKVESYHTRKSHVNFTQSLANTVKSSYFHHSFSYGGGGSGYGVECGVHTTDMLVEDNVFDSLRHAMLVQVGANGNVYSYNYSINPVQGDGETNLNQGWIPPDISIHGHYTYMNLFESNEVEEIGIADYWGPAGPGNTFFRNHVNGEGIFLYDESYQQNMIGNITTLIRVESNKNNDKIDHGNVVNDIVRWDSDISERNLPKSFYLDKIPPFFIEESWPMFGPDVSQKLKLPAQVRFERGNPTMLLESHN